MLSKAKMVMKQALESIRTGRATIYERMRIKDPQTKTMKELEVAVYESIPCRLSFNTSITTDEGQTNSANVITTLFVEPDVYIKEGSKIIVQQEGANYTLELSSKVKAYSTHNEYQVVEFSKYI